MITIDKQDSHVVCLRFSYRRAEESYQKRIFFILIEDHKYVATFQ